MPHIDPRIFPTILICLDFCAAVPYAVKGDMKMNVNKVNRYIERSEA